jgi:hypothetical protein
MSVTFLMIPILTLTPPTPLPSFTSFFPEPDQLNTVEIIEPTRPLPTFSFRQDEARTDLKEIVRCYLQEGGGIPREEPSNLPFTNFEPIQPLQEETESRGEKMIKSVGRTKPTTVAGKASWDVRKAKKARQQLVKVDQSLDNALSGFGW